VHLTLVSDHLAICRLSPDAAPPTPQSTFWSITRTTDELSVVCGEDEAPAGATSNPGWRALKIEGPFDLDAVGVLASLLPLLAAERVSVFVIATYDTDYILIRGTSVDRAAAALERAGHTVAGI
jgi:hypothetical protein